MTADNEELDALVANLDCNSWHYVSRYIKPHQVAATIAALRARIDHDHRAEMEAIARAESAESQLRQVKADAERMMKALDDIYNHNEASRAAVVMYYGVAHPAWLIDRRNDGTA